MSEGPRQAPAAPRERACKRLGADQWARLNKADRRAFHHARILLRRERQLLRRPNVSHRSSRSIAGGNRNLTRIGNKGAKHPPHEHSREIARRARQEARRSAQAPPG